MLISLDKTAKRKLREDYEQALAKHKRAAAEFRNIGEPSDLGLQNNPAGWQKVRVVLKPFYDFDLQFHVRKREIESINYTKWLIGVMKSQAEFLEQGLKKAQPRILTQKREDVE